MLYTAENFERLRLAGYKIALVTPELHATSHQDAKDKESLFKRINEIIKLRPNAICTNYSEDVRKMIEKELNLSLQYI